MFATYPFMHDYHWVSVVFFPGYKKLVSFECSASVNLSEKDYLLNHTISFSFIQAGLILSRQRPAISRPPRLFNLPSTDVPITPTSLPRHMVLPLSSAWQASEDIETSHVRSGFLSFGRQVSICFFTVAAQQRIFYFCFVASVGRKWIE